MKNLLYKEFKLCLYPQCIIFLIFCFMMFIPSYPYIVAYLYVFVCFTYIFNFSRENNDLYYSSLLPVPKKDIVKSRFLLVIAIELINALLCLIYTYVATPILYGGSIKAVAAAGMASNYTLLGIALVSTGIFNLIFLPMFYKTASKTGMPFLVGYLSTFVIAFVLYYICMIPSVDNIVGGNIFDSSRMIGQLVVLGIGIILYIITTFIAYKISIKNFNKVDL